MTENKTMRDILANVGDVVEEVIDKLSNKYSKLLEKEEIRHYVAKAYKQWKFGEKLTNPLITFTKELKAGYYDELPEKKIDVLHQAAVDLSGFWASEAEIDTESMKSNLGRLLIQEIIAGLIGTLDAGGTDVRLALEGLSWDKRYGRPM